MKWRELAPPYLWRSWQQRSVHRAHPDAPLIVASAVILLDTWLRPTDRGLEWGSGRSTAWLASRLAHLISVEHDQGWHERVSQQLRLKGVDGKVDYRLVPGPAEQMDEPVDHPYAGIADEVAEKSLDFVLVDGQMRLRCMQKACGKLKPCGLLVLDGANRYVPNRFNGGFTTIQICREEPLTEEWRQVLDGLRDWRWMNTTDGLWDTRLWIRPGK